MVKGTKGWAIESVVKGVLVTEYVKVLKEVYGKLFFASKEFFVKRRERRERRFQNYVISKLT